MTGDALECLRAANPVPHGSAAPPMEWVLSRIEGAASPPRRRHRGVARALVPALAVAATLAVVTGVVLLAVTHRSHAPAHVPPATHTTPALRSVPSPESLMPRGGMRGMLLILGAASPSADTAEVWFGQCQPCHAGGAGRGSASHDWMALTTDGGGSWRIARASANLNSFAFSGADGWAEGLESDGHGAGGVASFFATHDGGRTWHLVTPSGAIAPGGSGGVSIAGGEVWTIGNRCAGNNCVDAMLHGPATASHLSPTVGQPPLGDTTNMSVVATGRDDAYVLADDYGNNPRIAEIVRTRVFATHDGGRSWQHEAAACPTHTYGRMYAGGTTLWAVCDGLRRPTEVRRSTDGGGHWIPAATRLDNAQLQPASAQVAWAVVRGGRVVRTSDGGQTWSQVWYGGRPEPNLVSGNSPVLTVQSATTATVIVQLARGRVDGHAGRTDFVTYRTTDGGRTWAASVVRLPPG